MLAESERTPNLRWNAFFIGLDYVSFMSGTAFAHESTVLPAFVSNLTTSAPLIGMASTLFSGTWLLPQLIAASYIVGKERKKPYMLWPCVLGRPIYWLLALATVLLGASNPALLLGVLYVGVMGFAATDALVSVPWFDIMAKCIPDQVRGRFLGLCQILVGVLSVGVGAAVGAILTNPSLPFPNNYALLFFLAGVGFLISLIALTQIREPIVPVCEPSRGAGDFLRRLGPLLRTDRALARLVATRLLMGVGGMAYPFYIIYFTEVRGLGSGFVGAFLSVQMVGNIIASLLLGLVGDRFGTRLVIRLHIVIAVLTPLLALSAELMGAAAPVLVLGTAVFVFIGVGGAAFMVGFMNFVLENAAPADRATHIALFNTVTGGLAILPLFAGMLLEATSFAHLFAVGVVFTAVSFVMSLRLVEPRHLDREQSAA